MPPALLVPPLLFPRRWEEPGKENTPSVTCLTAPQLLSVVGVDAAWHRWIFCSWTHITHKSWFCARSLPLWIHEAHLRSLQSEKILGDLARSDSHSGGRCPQISVWLCPTNVGHIFMASTLLNTGELSKDAAKVVCDLPKTGPPVITRGGEIVGILIPPSGEGIEPDIDLLSRLRFGQALAAVQRDSVLNGSDGMSWEEIDAEIRAARAQRKKRYLESIEALVPDYFETLPLDIITLQPMRYRRVQPDEFLLWSVGWDEIDEGGQPGKKRLDGDWVWGEGIRWRFAHMPGDE